MFGGRFISVTDLFHILLFQHHLIPLRFVDDSKSSNVGIVFVDKSEPGILNRELSTGLEVLFEGGRGLPKPSLDNIPRFNGTNIDNKRYYLMRKFDKRP